MSASTRPSDLPLALSGVPFVSEPHEGLFDSFASAGHATLLPRIVQAHHAMVRARDVSPRGNYAREEQSMNSWRRQSMNSVSVLVLAVIAIVIALAPMVWAADVVEGRI